MQNLKSEKMTDLVFGNAHFLAKICVQAMGMEEKKAKSGCKLIKNRKRAYKM